VSDTKNIICSYEQITNEKKRKIMKTKTFSFITLLVIIITLTLIACDEWNTLCDKDVATIEDRYLTVAQRNIETYYNARHLFPLLNR